MSKKRTFKTVKDEDVQIFYVCSICKEKCSVYPDWHQDNGTPTCCDDDMIYDHTEVRM